MVDAIIVGAGPAGTVAALVMARAGARVVIVDRARLSREILCGDLLSPGALREIDSLGLPRPDAGGALPIHGWRLHAPHAPARVIVAEHPATAPLAIRRSYFDTWLLEAAVQAGARFEPGWRVRQPLRDEADGLIRGVVMTRGEAGGDVRLPAHLVIAADGRRSTLARRVGLHVPSSIRQHASGAYIGGMREVSDVVEIHVGPRAYCQVTPVGGGVANVWVVHHDTTRRESFRSIHDFLSGHRDLGARVGSMEHMGPARGSGVPGVTTRAAGVPGLLLAGDAAGFVEPVGGHGIHLAMLGGHLAADEALRTLESGDFAEGVERLGAARRACVDPVLDAARRRWAWMRRPVLMHAAGLGSRFLPGMLERAAVDG